MRKCTEEAFGVIKTVDALVETNLVEHAKLAGQGLLCFPTCNRGGHGKLVGCAACLVFSQRLNPSSVKTFLATYVPVLIIAGPGSGLHRNQGEC